MPPRRCLGCGRLTATGSRCRRCAAAIKAIRNSEARRAAAVVAAADVCACGCGRPPTADDPLQGGHVIPISKGGAGGPMQAERRSCNARKGNRV